VVPVENSTEGPVHETLDAFVDSDLKVVSEIILPIHHQLVARCERDAIQVGIVPDRHGTGTNALVITPPGSFEPAFGTDSLPRHLGRARGMGLAHRIEHVHSLAYDVDTPDDLAALWTLIDESKRGAQRTRGALSQLDRSGARAAIYGARPRTGLTVEA
jgi:2-phospho-L-lactate guanylyltransferase (CobY/MobA/RfbA family)